MFNQISLLFGLVVVLSINRIYANFHCLKCTSETDENCAEGSHPTSECLPEEDACYSRLVGGHVVRGCALDLPENNCLDDETCSFCSKSGCNIAFWPKCHQCDIGAVGCDEEQQGSPKFCGRISGSNNYCYARLDNGQVTRGCGEDLLCLFTPESCQICFNDGCNGLSKAALKPTKCQSCSASTEECIQGNTTKLSTDCSRLADSCVTAITSIASSASVIRTCSEQIGSRIRSCANSLNDNPLCVSCQGDNCNDKRWLRCHQCKVTNLDSSCKEEQNNQAMFCTHYREDDRCYTRVFDGFFERGCLSDLDVSANVCNETGAADCHLCDDHACNYHSAAILVTINYFNIIFCLFLAIRTFGLFF